MKLLYLAVLLAIPFISASAIKVDTANIYLNDNGNYVPYKLTQSQNSATVQSREGSFIFDKNNCSISFYEDTNTNGSPTIISDSYSVLASLGNTNNWQPVNVINNAACVTIISENNGEVSVTGSKSVSGAGAFSINYDKLPHQNIKLTFSATNNNPAWTNYHIGLRETLQVPQSVTLGNQTYDLSQHNNTSLSRTWIANHSAQLIHFGIHTFYDTGVGWSYLDHITIQWINNKAYLLLDYTFNTPIISPGQTITVDPAITLDAIAAGNSWLASTNATQFVTVTVGSNPNEILIAGFGHVKATTNHNLGVLSSVKVGGVSFTKIVNKTITCSTLICDTELWYLKNPPAGTYHVTFTMADTSLLSTGEASVYALYNVGATNVVGATNTNSSTSKGIVQTLTPLSSGSWIIDNVFTATDIGGTVALTAPSFTQAWNISVNAGNELGASQYNSAPSIGSSNKFTWQSTTSGNHWVEAAFELRNLAPATPTISKFNTINSTAINGTWNKPTGATWFWANVTLSGGATTHINTTNTYLLLNNYTAGSKYTLTVVAANSTGSSASSITKYNYTKNIAPTSLAASGITGTKERITWTNPTGNFSGFKVEKQPNHGTWTTVVSNTGNSTNHYDLTGLTQAFPYGVRISTNYAVGSNYSGTSSPSTILNFTTWGSTTANPVLNNNIVGDVVQLNGTTLITAGFPSPVTLNNVKLYLNGSLYNSTNLTHSIANGSSYNFTWWYQFPNANSQTFKYQATVTNFTGTPGQTNLAFNSSSIVVTRAYLPSYETAKTPSLGLVNYTISRPTPTTIVLAANRDLGGVTFPMECLYQTSSQAITGGHSGTWVNKTNKGYWYQAQTVSRSEVYYITCYDPNEELFNTRSLVNGSSVLFGIQGFDNTFGAFLGVPVGVFFIVMAASLGNRRTAPMWVVIILAIAGLMATIGFFTLNQNIWYLAIIAGLLGLFVGRKLF